MRSLTIRSAGITLWAPGSSSKRKFPAKAAPMFRREFLIKSMGAGAAAALPSFVGAQQLQPVNIVSTAGTTNVVIAALINRMGYFKQLGLTPNYITVADGNKVVAALISG